MLAVPLSSSPVSCRLVVVATVNVVSLGVGVGEVPGDADGYVWELDVGAEVEVDVEEGVDDGDEVGVEVGVAVDWGVDAGADKDMYANTPPIIMAITMIAAIMIYVLFIFFPVFRESICTYKYNGF